ncbi:alpha/beta hydrolase [Chitinibacteraceae bacterium HSL-7]
MSEVSLDSGSGSLHGTLLQPSATVLPPVLLILAGSGPTDRNGNQPGATNDCLKQLAEELAEKGIATLRVDKRGIGCSAAAGGDESRITLDTYVEDARRWLDWLRQSPCFSMVGVIGHSEGALIATLSASSPATPLILLCGASVRVFDLLREQLNPRLSGALRQTHERLLKAIELGPVSEIAEEFAGLYRPSVQPYLRSWQRYDPALELARVQAPVLLVGGGHDVQVRPHHLARLAAAKPDAVVVEIVAMNHVLKATPAAYEEQLDAYLRPDWPLSEGLIEAIASFITGLTRP